MLDEAAEFIASIKVGKTVKARDAIVARLRAYLATESHSCAQEFYVPGPLPGLNDLVAWAKRPGGKVGRSGRQWSAYAEQKRDWEEGIVVAILNAKIIPSPGLVFIRYVWFEPNRRRDPSNIAAGGRKLIEDALVRIGILRNDGWRSITGFSDHFATTCKLPGVRVSLELDPFRLHPGQVPKLLE